MSAGQSPQIAYAFGAFRLVPAERLLLRDGRPVALTPKAFDTLVALVERGGRIVEKDELLRRVWPDTAVEEATLAQNVFTLRKTLGEGSDGLRLIETVPKIGYRFVAPVERAEVEAIPPAAPVAPAVTAFRVPRWARGSAAALFVVVLGVAGYAAVERLSRHDPAGQLMMVVLPFENLSGDASQEYLSDGLTEEMIAQLGQLQPSRLGVIARTTAMTYRHTSKTAADIGRELGADYLLEGSVRRSGDRLRITAQLIATRNQTHVWSESYDRDMRDLLIVESGVAAAIARGVEVTLTPAARSRVASARPVDPEAQDLYLQGRYFWNMRTAAGSGEARKSFQRAIDRDGTDARSYAALAETYAGAGWAEQQQIAGPLVVRALALDDQLADAHISNAILKETAYDWAGAEQEFHRAIELDGNSVSARLFHAECLQAVGRHDEALLETERAVALDPVSVLSNQARGSTLFYARRYDAAITALLRTLELNPDYIWAHSRLARVYAQQTRFAEAEVEFRKAHALGLDTHWLPYLYALEGRTGEARAALIPAGPDYSGSMMEAFGHLALGDRPGAMQILQQAVASHDINVKYLNVDPVLDPLRHDRAFVALLRQAGLQ